MLPCSCVLDRARISKVFLRTGEWLVSADLSDELLPHAANDIVNTASPATAAIPANFFFIFSTSFLLLAFFRIFILKRFHPQV